MWDRNSMRSNDIFEKLMKKNYDWGIASDVDGVIGTLWKINVE